MSKYYDVELDVRHRRIDIEVDILDKLLVDDRECNRCTSDSRPDKSRHILDKLLF